MNNSKTHDEEVCAQFSVAVRADDLAILLAAAQAAAELSIKADFAMTIKLLHRIAYYDRVASTTNDLWNRFKTIETSPEANEAAEELRDSVLGKPQ